MVEIHEGNVRMHLKVCFQVFQPETVCQMNDSLTHSGVLHLQKLVVTVDAVVYAFSMIFPVCVCWNIAGMSVV